MTKNDIRDIAAVLEEGRLHGRDAEVAAALNLNMQRNEYGRTRIRALLRAVYDDIRNDAEAKDRNPRLLGITPESLSILGAAFRIEL